MNTTNQQFLERLQGGIEMVADDVMNLMISQHCFNRLVSIVKSNRNIREPNVFLEVFKFNYTAFSVSSICRQIDRSPQVVSLIKLLLEIERNASKITKHWFASQYVRTGRSYGLSEFQEFFGQLDYVDPSLVRADFEDLQRETRYIVRLRHKRIAHYDKEEFVLDRNLNFGYLNKAISIVERLTVKYYLLLRQVGHSEGLLPAGLEEEEAIFTFPWQSS